MQRIYKSISVLFLLVLSCFSGLQAQDYLPEKPKNQTSVYDYAKMMSEIEAKTLEQKLIRYNDTTSTQIVVITVNSLKENEIAMYATELAHKWGIGQAEKDNGILLLVSKEDKKMTIRAGYGVEHLLTDALSRRIIENIMKPEFRQNNFYGGIDKATTVIMQLMNGEFQGEPEGETGKGKGFPFQLIVIVFFIILMIFSRKNRRGGGKNGGKRRGGFSLLDAIILSSAGRGGFGGGGFGGGSSGGSFGGGGGFGGGFGGGGFGGGGASGGW